MKFKYNLRNTLYKPCTYYKIKRAILIATQQVSDFKEQNMHIIFILNNSILSCLSIQYGILVYFEHIPCVYYEISKSS